MNKDRYYVIPEEGVFRVMDSQTGQLVETLATLPVADAICKKMNDEQGQVAPNKENENG